MISDESPDQSIYGDKMIELERTYLVKYIPDGLKEGKEMVDIYIPKSKEHPVLRIRKKGDQFEMTKKFIIEEGDASKLQEDTIRMTKEEFESLLNVDGKRVSKIRYKIDHNGRTAEIDVFQEALKGLVLVDFEFNTEEEKDKFIMPDFCLAEVTQEEFIAGGMICGKSYEDIEEDLKRFNYKKVEQ